jgi:hypothetical protein
MPARRPRLFVLALGTLCAVGTACAAETPPGKARVDVLTDFAAAFDKGTVMNAFDAATAL